MYSHSKYDREQYNHVYMEIQLNKEKNKNYETK
jgi:hypothetical protein